MRIVFCVALAGLGLLFTSEQATAQYPSYGYGNSLPSGYGGGIAYPQYNTPQVSSYYSNNYYGRLTHSHHSWHPGHYLSGHH